MKKLFPIFFIFLFCFQKSFSQTNANQFKWINGSSLTNQPGNYGASSSCPGARKDYASWELNGKLYLYGGAGYDEVGTLKILGDLWAYDTQTNNWTFLKGSKTVGAPINYGTIGVESNTNTPGSRSRSCIWILNGKTYLMGGTDGNSIFNDLWVYDPNTNNWTWLKGNNTPNPTGNYGVFGIEATTNLPPAKYLSSTWVYNNKLYLMGEGYGQKNDLWVYNPTTNNWTWLKGSATSNSEPNYGNILVEKSTNIPGGRYGSVTWTYNGKLYLFGGYGQANLINSNLLDDLWVYNPINNNWTWLKGDNLDQPGIYPPSIGIEGSSYLPGSRESSYSWTFNGKLYLFGGSGKSSSANGALNDLWEYNPATNNFKWINGSNSANQIGSYGTINYSSNTNSLSGKYAGSTWYYNNKLYLFGGLSGPSSYNNDLWEYDPVVTNNWTWIKGRNIQNVSGIYNSIAKPGARQNAMSWSYNNKFYLFGGYGKDENGNEGNMNDFWEYNPSTSTWNWLNGSKFRADLGNYGTINVPNASNLPTSRYAANTWTYNNKLYMFGGTRGFSGFSYSLDFNDLWEYNPTNNIWTWIKGPNTQGFTTGNYGNLGLEAINNIPGARESATVWTNNNNTYLFGGKYTNGVQFDAGGIIIYNPIESYQNDLWVFNHSTNNWTWLKGANIPDQQGLYINGAGFETPGARESGTAVVINGKAYLHGGYGFSASNFGYLNDLWEYNFATNLWVWKRGSNGINQSGNYGTQSIANNTNIPGSRFGAISWVYNNKFFMFGGFGNGNSASSLSYLNDLWEYKPSTNNWTWLKGSFSNDQGGSYGTLGTYASTNIPGARTAPTTFSFNNKLYLFGGFGYGSGIGAGYLNDLWEYTPACTETYSVASGNWNAGSTWSCNKVPLVTESVNIYSHTIDLTGNGYAKEIIYNPTGTVRLSVGGNLILNP